MIFNRIINDIVDWIRRLLHWQDKKVLNKPYTILEIYTFNHGVLKLVDRDTPRAVLTYIYTPKPIGDKIKSDYIYDFHICLDHLWVISDELLNLDNIKKEKKDIENIKEGKDRPFKVPKNLKVGDPSHILTILRSSRFLDSNGDYITEILYHKKFDFVGFDNTGYRDKFAIPIIKDVIHILKEQEFKDIDWDFEISFSQKRFMGSYYSKPKVE